MHIILFHYHIFDGGVTHVLLTILSVLKSAKRSPFKTISICCGSAINCKNIAMRIADMGYGVTVMQNNKLFYRRGSAHVKQIKILINKDLFYRNDSKIIHALRKKRIIDYLKSYINPNTVWWIHNYHLGKNCAFTAALLSIMKNYDHQKILLHIHDFPEQGRFKNLSKINTLIHANLYPTHTNIKYIVINDYDYHVLQKSGLPKQMLFLLLNPLQFANPQKIKEGYALAPHTLRNFRETINNRRKTSHIIGTHIDLHTKIILYPVRTIRRKNILEAALLTRCMNAMDHRSGSPPLCALLVTLPSNSKPERKYARVIADEFKKNIYGMWSVGLHLKQFAMTYQNLVSASSAIISTSVQEGFGFSILEALLASKLFICRNLHSLDTCARYFAKDQLINYSGFNIPWSISFVQAQKKKLYAIYRQRILRNRSLYTATQIAKLKSQLDELFSQSTIDFSYLDIYTQRKIVSLNIKDDISPIITENHTLCAAFYDALRKDRSFSTNLSPIVHAFGNVSFNRALMDIMETFKQPHTAPVVHALDNAIKQEFIDIAYLRALLNF